VTDERAPLGPTGPEDDPSARREPPSTRRAHLDPFGKRALFWAQPETVIAPDPTDVAPGDPTSEVIATGDDVAPAAPLGKHALYSAAAHEPGPAAGDPSARPLADRGPVTVECSRCGVVTRIGFLDLLIYQFPIGYWLPGRKFDHRMTCPACRRRAWASVTLRRR
jgi:hypothetical protein